MCFKGKISGTHCNLPASVFAVEGNGMKKAQWIQFLMSSCPTVWTVCHHTCHGHQNKLTNLCVCLFQGVIGDIRVLKDPGAAERHCEEDEDDFDAVRLKAHKCSNKSV